MSSTKQTQRGSDYHAGVELANPPPGEEVVLAGISGRYPNSDNVAELKEQFLNKEYLVKGTDWGMKHPLLPKRFGRVKSKEKFDAAFFGISPRQAHCMDSATRLLLEAAYEAIMDAGVNPEELRGSKTGVYIGVAYSETEYYWIRKGDLKYRKDGVYGSFKSMMPYWISYSLGLCGPSFTIDCGCSASITALVLAYQDILSGKVDNALIGGTNSVLNPIMTTQFVRIGLLDKDGICRPFDNNAAGFARGESSSVIFLQRARNARRIYARVVHTKANTDGYKEKGITNPYADAQAQLITQVLDEVNVHPDEIDYLECHATATRVGDLEELTAVTKALCEKRTKPLLIGSGKGNAGHIETASGMIELAKVILNMEIDWLIPNIHYTNPKEGCDALADGRLKIVTDLTPWPTDRGLAAINNFGWGGSNAFVLLQRNKKKKINGGLPLDNIPRLLCASGRTEDAVQHILDKVTLDEELISLLHAIYRVNIPRNLYRGFTILSKQGELSRSVEYYSGCTKPLAFAFGGPDKKLLQLGVHLLGIPVFEKAVEKIDKILSKKDVNVQAILRQNIYRNDGNIIGSVAVQLALTQVFDAIELRPRKIYGYSVGEIASAYVNKSLTLEEALLTACAVESSMKSTDSKEDSKISRDVLQKLVKISTGKWTSLTENGTRIDQSGVVLQVGALKNVGGGVVMAAKSSAEFMQILGNLYQQGYDMKLDGLYPKVEWPVSAGTEMIGPLIKWNHSKDWFVPFPTPDPRETLKFGKQKVEIGLKATEWSYVLDYVVNETTTMPPMSFLRMVWEAVATRENLDPTNLQIVMEDVRFHNAVSIEKDQVLEMLVSLGKTGKFEVTYNDDLIVTGRFYTPEDISQEMSSASQRSFKAELSSEDVYKELRLRGYNYVGQFCGITSCNIETTKATIKRNHLNWVPFLECLLQVDLLHRTDRKLLLLEGIERIAIDTQPDSNSSQTDDDDEETFGEFCETLRAIRSEGVEIKGVTWKEVPRKILKEKPILEKYTFVPFEGGLSLKEALRVATQIVVENCGRKVKVIEIEDDESPCLKDEIHEAVNTQPLVQIESKTVGSGKIANEKNVAMVVGWRLLAEPQILEKLLNVLKPTGCILTREDLNSTPLVHPQLNVVAVYQTGAEKLILLNKKQSLQDPIVVDLCEDFESYNWMEPVKSALKQERSVILVAQQELTGIMGFAQSLFVELNTTQVKCFFTVGAAPKFDLQDEFYREQVEKGLTVNIWKDGRWGSLRYLLMDYPTVVECDRVVAERVEEELRWVEGPLPSAEDAFVRVHWMTLQKDKDHFAFAGVTRSNDRVMGICRGRPTNLVTTPTLLWNVPSGWTLKEAATVPLAYTAAIYGLIEIAQVKRGEVVLIHNGNTGAGQAAIHVALQCGCVVLTTVESQKDGLVLKENFPKLSGIYVGSPSNLSFERAVLKQTYGRGVDVILNGSKSPRGSQNYKTTSVRCLRLGGRYVDVEPTPIKERCHFYRVDDTSFLEKDVLGDELKKGYVKPVQNVSFSREQLEENLQATLASPNGEVLVQTGEGNGIKWKAIARVNCSPEASYIIPGGLGGIGLELCDFLVKRGARKFVINARRGVRNGYQALRLRIWKKQGVQTHIFNGDLTTRTDCERIIEEANRMGSVEGIFNLAAHPRDGLFENQTKEMFSTCMKPKFNMTRYLDEISRKMCPRLRYFVVFSSIACRGVIGLSNYAMANSTMERICERRRRDGLPATSMQWGPIADVGIATYVQGTDVKSMYGVYVQPLSSCFSSLEDAMRRQEPCMACTVLVPKSDKTETKENPLTTLAKVLGLSDWKKIAPHTSFAELGMDSIMIVEVKDLLEDDMDVYLPLAEIRSCTFTRLQELIAEKSQ